MKKFFLFIIFCVSFDFLHAQTSEPRYMHLVGTLGKLPVTMDLVLLQNQAVGRYYLDKLGQPIFLHDGDFEKELPNLGKENFYLAESYGYWEGKIKKNRIIGTWTSADRKKQLPFELVENYAQSMQFKPYYFDNSQLVNANSKVEAQLLFPFALKNQEVLKQLQTEIGKKVVGIGFPNSLLLNAFQYDVLKKFDSDKEIQKVQIQMSIFLNESNLLTISSFQSGTNKKGNTGTIRSEYATWDLATGKEITSKLIFKENHEEELLKILGQVIKRDYDGKVFGNLVTENYGVLKGGIMFVFDNEYLSTEVFVSYKELASILKPDSPLQVLFSKKP
jgi:hypothetical protein